MSRQARDISNNKVYHAIHRGVNKQQIFECSEDYEHFVRILQRQCGLPVETRPSKVRFIPTNEDENLSDDCTIPLHVQQEMNEAPERHCYLYAWCLMGNHVHLLIKECGIKPQLVADLKDYRWSSWNEYLGHHPMPFTSTQSVLSRITLDELSELVVKPLSDEEEADLLDIDVRPKKSGLSDDEVWQLIHLYSGVSNATQFQSLPRHMQKHYLYMMHEEGVGPRTLSRLTGVSYSVVRNATTASQERERQEIYEQRSAMMACECIPGDEDWLSYCDEDEYDKYPEF